MLFYRKMKDKMFGGIEDESDDAPSFYKLVANLRKIEIHNTTQIGEIINILQFGLKRFATSLQLHMGSVWGVFFPF